jgi:serine/threonine protein kinase
VPAAEALEIGQEPIPGYRLRRRIGTGGYGQVWAAETADGRPLALKFIPCDGKLAAAREVRSLQSIRELRHPHLIRIEQVWCHLGYVVIAMELADGSLMDLLDVYQTDFGTPVAPEHTCQLLGQAAEALDFLNTRRHRLGVHYVYVQHCDIKPSNLLLLGNDLKVADFGLLSGISSRLQSHHKAGTLPYSAPEIFQGRLSNQTDQYALAVTYCQLRGSRLPFTDTPSSFRSDYVRPAPDLTMLPEAERPIIARALNPVPQNRWPTCAELIHRLRRAIP